MKKPFIVSTEQLAKLALEFEKSDFAKQKTENAKKAYQQNEIWLKPLLEELKNR